MLLMENIIQGGIYRNFQRAIDQVCAIAFDGISISPFWRICYRDSYKRLYRSGYRWIASSVGYRTGGFRFICISGGFEPAFWSDLLEGEAWRYRTVKGA